MIILLVIAAVVVGAPIAAALLVSVASLREDADQSLHGRSRNPIDRAARRLLSVPSRGIGWPPAPRVPPQRRAGTRGGSSPRVSTRGRYGGSSLPGVSHELTGPLAAPRA
jgi:hypothetical protein